MDSPTADDDRDATPITDFIAVPDVFHSWYDKGPFAQCMICSRDLLVDGVQYLVEKAFVGDEVVYEYALCLKCCEGLREELSRASMQRITAHFDERVDLPQRRERLLEEAGHDVDRWIDRCILTKKERSECRSWAIYAHCDGPDLLFHSCPYMISDHAMRDAERLLSKKTRDRLEDFIDEHFGLPSEFKDLPVMFV